MEYSVNAAPEEGPECGAAAASTFLILRVRMSRRLFCINRVQGAAINKGRARPEKTFKATRSVKRPFREAGWDLRRQEACCVDGYLAYIAAQGTGDQ